MLGPGQVRLRPRVWRDKAGGRVADGASGLPPARGSWREAGTGRALGASSPPRPRVFLPRDSERPLPQARLARGAEQAGTPRPRLSLGISQATGSAARWRTRKTGKVRAWGYNSDEMRPLTLLIKHLMEGGRRDHHAMTIIIAEFHKKIKEAFEVFDHESNNTVDVREIGTIIRSLGCCPTEGELHDLIAEVEEEEPTGYIRFEKFLPVMTEILLERKYRPIPEDVLLRAFEVLDSAKRGFLTKDELIKYMTEEGKRDLLLITMTYVRN
uniref:EF-hand calcium binding domain 2 n=1 Tax=Nomascus leucogenys TaxID=61853 RepID=A0A2I3HSB3_NOMLE